MGKKNTIKVDGMPWDFASLFNEALRSIPERVPQKRSHMWASELGGDFCSRYLLMHAHPQTNPINERSKRKMAMGHIVEWTVSLILTVIGIIKAKQLRGEVELPGLLKVTGKLDFIAGGNINWDESRERLKEVKSIFSTSIDDVPPIIFHSIEKILPRMEMTFAHVPLMEMILECKSIASILFEIVEKSGKPRPTHIFQALHYLIANKDVPKAAVLYVSKDDAMMAQFEVERSKQLLKAYKEDVATMTDFYNNSGKNYIKNLPPKAPEVTFTEGIYRFEKNQHVEYSKYLTMLYGYKDFDEYRWKWARRLSGWNRVFKRIVREENLTAANKEIIDDLKLCFPEMDKYVVQAKKAGAFQKIEEEEE